ncbi:MAG: copper-transporting ATPase, partial [Planctomycetaceae bacterium]|nr:copper-transporting ATPase [Planctomycetaceae bacterium]
MALEPVPSSLIRGRTFYTCPMHPDVEQDHPGHCPICGMDLEPKTFASEEEDAQLVNMTFRFRLALLLSLPVFLLAMLPMTGAPVNRWLGHTIHIWLQLVLSTPVVLWAGWPFFVRGGKSVISWNLNMFTLIAMGTGAA